MMLHFLIALLTLAFSGSPAQTQTWYFGQLTDSKQVIAFTSSGDVHRLGITGDAQYGVRVDAQTALFLLTDSRNLAHLYHVTPDKATEIVVPGGADQLRKALAASASYVVLTHNAHQPSAALLIDLASDQATRLSGQVVPVARLSQDRKLLRYMSNDGARWSLIERTLATGQERVIYSAASTDQYAASSANHDGTLWLYLDSSGSGKPQFDLIASDGTVTQLDDPATGQGQIWGFFDNALLGITTDCSSSCTMEVRSGTADTIFTLPANDNYQLLAVPQSGMLLVMDSASVIWLLRSGDSPVNLGKYDPTRVFEQSSQLLSPDNRYLLTQSSDDEFSVLDLTSAKPIAQISGTAVGQIFYTAQGFTIHSYGATIGTDQAIAYRYSDGQTLTLPNAQTSLYFDMLSDGTLLDWNQTQTAGIGAAGIYRYDPAAQKYTPIVTNARILVAHPVS